MDKIVVNAFVREAGAVKKINRTNKDTGEVETIEKDIKHTIGGYIRVTRAIHVSNPMFDVSKMKPVKENYMFGEQAQDTSKVMLKATKAQRAILQAHKARLEEKYVGQDVHIAFGNIQQLNDEVRENENGEKFIQKQRRTVPESAYLAVFDSKLIQVYIYLGDNMMCFFGEEYAQKESQRYYASLQQTTDTFIAPIGDHQIISRDERNGKKSDAETEMLVIRLLEEGISPTNISRRLSMSRTTVYNIKKRYMK